MSKRKARAARVAGAPMPKGEQMKVEAALASSKVELRQMEKAITIYKDELTRTMIRPRPIGEIPEYKRRQIAARSALVERLSQNGITPKDLENEYQKGYDNARADLTSFCMQFFYCGAAIAAHNLFGFGETRIERLLTEMQRVMTEEIDREDIRERCKRETGVDVIERGYDSMSMGV